MKSWPLNRDGVVVDKISSLRVKNSPRTDGSVMASRRRKPFSLPRLSRCVAAADNHCHDVIPDVTSSDSYQYSSDVAAEDYDMERRRTSTAEVDVSSPVNSSGVHIVIGDEYDDVTCADDQSTSGIEAPSADTS